jgi:bacterioferritin (cytochrome b1)
MDLSLIQTEIDAWFLYSKLAEKEADPIVADIFRQMSEIEFSHAQAFAEKMKVSIDLVSKPSWRAKTILRIGKLFGYEYILGTLLDTEKGLADAVMKQKKSMQMPLTGAEDAHVQILRNILDHDQKVSPRNFRVLKNATGPLEETPFAQQCSEGMMVLFLISV